MGTRVLLNRHLSQAYVGVSVDWFASVERPALEGWKCVKK